MWFRCEYDTFPFPVLSNTAVINLSRSSAPAIAALADSILPAFSELSTFSRPQQLMACTRRVFVKALSLVSRKHRTMRGFLPFPLQFSALQVNSWHLQLHRQNTVLLESLLMHLRAASRKPKEYLKNGLSLLETSLSQGVQVGSLT